MEALWGELELVPVCELELVPVGGGAAGGSGGGEGGGGAPGGTPGRGGGSGAPGARIVLYTSTASVIATVRACVGSEAGVTTITEQCARG